MPYRDLAVPFTGHTDWVNSVAFSPDSPGHRLKFRPYVDARQLDIIAYAYHLGVFR